MPDLPIPASALFPPKFNFLKLEVIDTPAGMRLTVFRVAQVYVGSSKLKGSCFATPLVAGREGLVAGSAFLLGGELRKGDVGLFVVEHDPDTSDFKVLSLWEAAELNVHVAIDGNKHYADILDLAGVPEAIFRASEDNRLHVIDGLIRSGNAVRAGIAFCYLKRVTDPAVMPYLVTLNGDASLPLALQMELNDLLRVRRKGWAGSSADVATVSRWFSSTAPKRPDPMDFSKYAIRIQRYSSAKEEESLNGYLHTLAVEKRFVPNQILALAVTAVANPNRSSKFKKRALAELARSIHWKTWTDDDRDQGFAYLIKHIGGGPNVAEKMAAATLLDTYAPLNADHRKRVQTLLAGDLDSAVADQLRAVLKAE